MLDQNLLASVQDLLTPAQTVFILLPQKPTFDQTAAGLSLYLSLKKNGKTASLACSEAMKVEYSNLVGIDQIKTELAGRNLIISFDEKIIEKVSYNFDNQRFNLVIQPKPGYSPPDTDKINYSYSGGQADLVVTIGCQQLNNLGRLYYKSKNTFKKEILINLDLNPDNGRFGRINLVDPLAASFSEMIAQIISRFNLPLDSDIGSNLLQGIEKATQKFSSPKVRAETFEAAAFCLRAGGRRAVKTNSLFPKDRDSAVKPMPQSVSKAKKPSPDWLQPKIYKGNTKI